MSERIDSRRDASTIVCTISVSRARSALQWLTTQFRFFVWHMVGQKGSLPPAAMARQHCFSCKLAKYQLCSTCYARLRQRRRCGGHKMAALNSAAVHEHSLYPVNFCFDGMRMHHTNCILEDPLRVHGSRMHTH